MWFAGPVRGWNGADSIKTFLFKHAEWLLHILQLRATVKRATKAPPMLHCRD